MKQIFLTTMLFLFLFSSCKKDVSPVSSKIFKGTPIRMGNGGAWSWIEIGTDGQPKTLGLTFEEAAFENLPSGTNQTTEYEFEPTLPSQKTLTPFNHIVVGWNPFGHPPTNIYDKPHFDLHFYLMEEADRLQVPAYGIDSTGFQLYPVAGYLPATYFPFPGGEPKMGKHWADGTSPELNPVNPQVFTQTFIYGSYKGNVTFYEPMVTLDFLKTTTSFTRDIPQPLKWSKDGYYPTKLSVMKTHGTCQVTLHDFVYRSK